MTRVFTPLLRLAKTPLVGGREDVEGRGSCVGPPSSKGRGVDVPDRRSSLFSKSVLRSGSKVVERDTRVKFFTSVFPILSDSDTFLLCVGRSQWGFLFGLSLTLPDSSSVRGRNGCTDCGTVVTACRVSSSTRSQLKREVGQRY